MALKTYSPSLLGLEAVIKRSCYDLYIEILNDLKQSVINVIIADAIKWVLNKYFHLFIAKEVYNSDNIDVTSSITMLFQYNVRLSFSSVIVIMNIVIKIRRRILAVGKIFMFSVLYRYAVYARLCKLTFQCYDTQPNTNIMHIYNNEH